MTFITLAISLCRIVTRMDGRWKMKKMTVFAIATGLIMLLNSAQAGVSLVANGSFEADGESIDITAENTPYRWDDVNLPGNEFGASLWVDWHTQGYYDLIIYSYDQGTFDVNDMGTISQQVYLTDVNEIIFDVRLDTYYWDDPWNPAVRSAVMLLDDNVVWESNSVGTDVRDVYRNQIYTVDPAYKDGIPHKLSLGLRANMAGSPGIEYYAMWDFVKFDTHCGGFGYLPGDIDHDCCVDINDLKIFAENWLTDDPNARYDLFEDENSTVNFRDMAVMANYWMNMSSWADYEDPNFVEPELVLVDADIDFDGIVGYGELQMIADNWLAEGEGLGVNYYIDEESETDLIDWKDFAVFAQYWLEKSTIYYWN